MMERFKWMVLILLLMTGIFLVHAGTSRAAPADESVLAAAGSVEAKDTAGYLENISFEKAGQKERVTLILSKQSGVQVDFQAPNAVIVTLQNLFVPQDLRKPLGEGTLNNVLRAVASQKSTAGSPVALVRIDLGGRVPYSVKQVGSDVVLDFNLVAADIKAPEVTMQEKKQASATLATSGNINIITPGSQPDQKMSIKQNGDEKLTINLQDATVKETLELLATRRPELSIISTDDVDLKGKVTVHIKNIAWEKALDTILKLKGLAKQQDGNVVMISTVQKMREDDAERKKTQEELKKRLQEEMVEKGKLRQVSIEAKIIEATQGFVRNLGVQWAYGSAQTLSSHYSMGILAGTNTNGILNTSLTPPALTTLPTGVALTKSALAVNFPVAQNPTLGVVIGSNNSLFSAQLSALETTSEAKVISSPRVVTMDGEVATIEQGSEIPVVTPASANTPATTTYKKAVLSLKVRPIITTENKISMELSANNDRPDTAEKDPATGNMPIFTNKIDSKVVVSDGDTVVIGGIQKSEDTKGTTGVPWLSRIPIIGWLFKSEITNRTNDEIYIVVTPRILKAEDVSKSATGK